MNVNKEILQNGDEENRNENGSSQEKNENAKKVTKKQAAKAKHIVFKKEAQKKDASCMPTMLSKLWQQFISFQVMAILTAEGKTEGKKGLHDTALVLYKKTVI